MTFPIKSKKSIIILASGLILLGLFIGLYALTQKEITAKPAIADITMVPVEDRYSTYLTDHANADENMSETHEIKTADLVLQEGETLEENLQSYRWINDSTVSFQADIEQPGMYLIYIDYQSLTDSVIPISLAVRLNGALKSPYAEASQITLNTLWKSSTSEMGKDRYGNDVNVLQETYDIWQHTPLRDASRLYEDGLRFYLEAGVNTIEITKNDGSLLLGGFTLKARPQEASYAEYLSAHANEATTFMKRYEAENMAYKNVSTISLGTSRDVGVLPFSLTKLKLNVLGTDSYNAAGDAVTWKVDVPAPGYYDLTFKVLQAQQNTTSYRTLYVNGEIPFAEARHLAFSYSRNWQNVTLQSLDHEPYLIYLQPGDEITLAVDSTLFANVAEKLSVITSEMTELGLNITKLTRNNTDKGIDWEMLDYFPDLNEKLAKWNTDLNEINGVLRSLNGFEKDSQTVQDIDASISKIEKIASNINELPRRLALLSKGSSCAVTLLANQIDVILRQPMIVDAFYVHTPDQELPKANGSFFEKLKVSVSRFVMSFFDKSYSDKAEDDEIEVWVNRSRQYVDLMQKISDDVFTAKTGYKVKVSIMSDDGKLLLANSANRQPDVALGVSAWIPNEYGMRGMLYDLTKEPDFRQAISVYNPEQLVPMIYDNKLYGMPETENFYVMFYRKDILSELGLNVPNTWNDVLDMLPVLDRYGMSFYIPLSSTSSAKSFDTTAPFIYQFGGKLYADNGLSAAVDNEQTIQALTFMTDLYREYSMPYQVPSFFNSFRYGQMPIGIADFGTYLQLVNAASEISGLWDIAVVPGVEHTTVDSLTQEETVSINRSMPGAQQAGIIFNKSDKKHEAWEYLSWWMSTDTQRLFSETLVNTLGSRYMWNSANIEAFKQFSWKAEHKEVILEQWNHLKEVPKIPGSYIVEREISNTWNNVVYNDANLRSSVSDAIIKMNKEISRKMKEFGYLDSEGNVIREFNLPTADIVKAWGDEDD